MKSKFTKQWMSIVTVFILFSTLIIPTSITQAENEDIIIEDVMIPMRDGVKLAAKVYRPVAKGKYPVLFARTPYNSGAFGLPGYFVQDYKSIGTTFTKMGYAVVVQDVRGTFASEGISQPFKGDDVDGYDTLEWIAQQEWSNQKVGMFGASARGMTQTAMMDTNSPYLKALFVEVAPSQYYEEVLFQGGAFRQEGMQVWLASQNNGVVEKAFGTGSPEHLAVVNAFQNIPGPNGLFWYLPLKEFPTLGIGKTALPGYQEIFEHYVKDGYFNYMDIKLKHPKSHIPAYHVGGWYDIFRDGTVNNFIGLQENGGTGAKGNQKILMGPWQHREIGNSPLIQGDEVDINSEMKRWFDYWLKGIDNGIMKEKPVRYFNMGSNEWKEAEHWPLDSASTVDFYFHKEHSGTAQSINDGVLEKNPPKKNEEPDKYEYDPNNPTLTIGGQLLYPDVNVQNKKGLVGPMDQREAEKSSLTYTTDVLNKDLNVTGNITATVYASSDRPDTDFVVRLTDVNQDGTSTLITDGIIRVRFRDGQDHEEFMKSGKVYPFEIRLGNTSHTFKKGHRIRVAVANSNFPHFGRNTNSGKPIGTDTQKDIVIAHNNIYLDKIYPSHISLPVVKDK